MQIFDKETINEALKLKDGTEFIFEYVAAGVGYQEKAIKMGKDIYYKMDSNPYTDGATGKPLECYCFFDKNENMRVAVKTLTGEIELK